MFHFLGKSSKLLPKVNTRLLLLSLLILVLVSLCMGCAMTPSVSRKDLPLSTQIQKLPLKAVVVFPQKFQDAMIKSGFGELYSTARVGKSSVALSKEVFPLLFQEVEFVAENVTPKHYQILIIPEITEVYSHQKGDRVICDIGYELSFFDSDHKMIFQTSARGSGYFSAAKAGILGGLTLVGGPAVVAAAKAKAFGKAEAQAMSKLIDNITVSSELLAYADNIKGRIVEHKPEKVIQKIAMPQHLPKLICEVSFSEPSGNNILDAQEEGKLLVTVENKGKGDANQVQIDLNTIEPIIGLSHIKQLFIKSIPASESIYKEITLQADKAIPTSQVQFKVQAKETGGVESEPAVIVFKTREFGLPEIYDISDDAKQKQKVIAVTSTHSTKQLSVLKLPHTTSVPKVNKWAVIIGISQYLHSGNNGLANLMFADDDAKAFAYTLCKLGWTESHIKLLINKKATERNIKIALKSWLTKARPEDHVILFWAGHGYPDPEDFEKVYFATYDTDISIPVTGYRMDEVRKALEEIGPKNVILLADTCHAGKLITRGGGRRGISIVPNIQKMNREQKVPKGWIFMVGADTDRQAIEHTSWANGAFTHSLIKGLNGEADGFQSAGARDGIVTMGELKDYMKTAMPDETQKILGVAKHPVITTSTGDPDIWNLTLQVTQ